jgi:hypothetical protein
MRLLSGAIGLGVAAINVPSTAWSQYPSVWLTTGQELVVGQSVDFEWNSSPVGIQQAIPGWWNEASFRVVDPLGRVRFSETVTIAPRPFYGGRLTGVSIALDVAGTWEFRVSGNYTIQWYVVNSQNQFIGWNPQTYSYAQTDYMSVVPANSDIAVEFPLGSNITNNAPAIPFSPTIIGQSSTVRTYTVKNVGYTNLAGLSFVKDGAQSSEFVVSNFAGILAPGSSTNISVTFTPQAAGTRTASIRIASNDPDENPFILNFEGVGQLPPLPDIAMEQPLGSNISNLAPAQNFPETLACVCQGSIAPASNLTSLEYTIRNVGEASLDVFSITETLGDTADFEIHLTNSNFPVRLAVNQMLGFAVTFNPKSGGNKSAQISISSNDPDEEPFILSVAGFGIGQNVDSDQDGLNDAAEFCMSPLGFNWKLAQPSLVQNLYQNAWLAGLYSSNAVATNPSVFNLFTATQYDSNRAAGRADVINNPASFGLFTSNSIMDLRMSGLMIQKQGANAVVSFQPQTTTDLATQPFTNNGTAITNVIPMPANKGFIRIQANPKQTSPQ